MREEARRLIDFIHLDEGNSGSSILSFDLGAIIAGFEIDKGRRTQAAWHKVV